MEAIIILLCFILYGIILIGIPDVAPTILGVIAICGCIYLILNSEGDIRLIGLGLFFLFGGWASVSKTRWYKKLLG